MDLEKESNDRDSKNLEENYPKIEKKTNSQVLKQELKWNKKGESSLCRGYGVRLKLSRKKERKSAWK